MSNTATRWIGRVARTGMLAGGAVLALGGAVALQFAWDYPERTERLVLVDAVAGYEGRGGSPAPLLGEVLRHTPLGPLLFAWGFEDDARFRKALEFTYHDPSRVRPATMA